MIKPILPGVSTDIHTATLRKVTEFKFNDSQKRPVVDDEALARERACQIPKVDAEMGARSDGAQFSELLNIMGLHHSLAIPIAS